LCTVGQVFLGVAWTSRMGPVEVGGPDTLNPRSLMLCN